MIKQDSATNNTIAFSFLEPHKKEKEKQNLNHWKCEKCNKLFSRFKLLKQHKEEYHAY
jgi:hypothetical protein